MKTPWPGRAGPSPSRTRRSQRTRLSAKVSTLGAAHWWLTVVYRPQADAAKVPFMQELRDVRDGCPGPWMLYVDFNLIYTDEDKNNRNLNHRMMGRFGRVIDDLALKEVYLSGRRYTWANE